MTKEEALIRIKTGYCNGEYGFDWSYLVDAFGTIGEMLRNGYEITKIVYCKDCVKRKYDNCQFNEFSLYIPEDDFFCKEGATEWSDTVNDTTEPSK